MKNIVRINLAECFAHKPQPLDFVFTGLLVGDVGAIVSPGGKGKSFLVFDMGVAVTTGYDLTHGALSVKKTGKVTYLNGEDKPETLRTRFHSLGNYLNDDVRKESHENFKVLSLKGSDVFLMDENGKPVQKTIDWLTRISEGQRLVVLDTLRRFHLGDENNSGHMSRLLSILEGIALKTGPAYLFNHHTNKASAFAGKGGEQGASRGSSVLTDNVRFQANLVQMTDSELYKRKIDNKYRDKIVKFVTSKVNNSEQIDDMWLLRDQDGILTGVDLATLKKPVTNTGRTGRYVDGQGDDGDC